MLKSSLALAIVFSFCTWSLLRWLDTSSVLAALHYPLRSNDVWLTVSVIKAFLQGDWGLFGLVQTPHLGAPFGFNMGDFPSGYQLYYILIWVIGWFTSDPVIAFNALFVLGFYACALSFFFCARRLGSSLALGVPLSLAFAILPFHFARYEHLFFSTYFLVPPICLVVYFFALGLQPVRVIHEMGRLRVRVTSRRQLLASAGVVTLNALTGIYSSFFFCFLLSVALLMSGWKTKILERLLWFTMLIALTFCVTLVDHNASIRYTHANTPNTAIGNRAITDNEVLGLRLATFILPSNSYFIEPLRKRVQGYVSVFTPIEGLSEYGGLLAVIGLICSVGALLTTLRGRSEVLVLGRLNLGAILFSVLGGLNIIFALFFTTSFRGMNRISVFIACFSLLAVMYLFDRHLKRLSAASCWLIVLLISVFVVYDQTPVVHAALSAEETKIYDDGQKFFSMLDGVCDSGASILQLPFIEFPEAPAPGKMHEYEHMAPYVWSQNLRWSYGTMRGREPELAVARLSLQPLDLATLLRAGYSGVEIDMNGYDGHVDEILRKLKAEIGTAPLTSENLRWFFYELPGGACHARHS